MKGMQSCSAVCSLWRVKPASFYAERIVTRAGGWLGITDLICTRRLTVRPGTRSIWTFSDYLQHELGARVGQQLSRS